MKSPFPGMDPYLEAFRGDLHTTLITYARDMLQPQMPSGLRARIQEQEVVGEEPPQRFLTILGTRPSNRLITLVDVVIANFLSKKGYVTYIKRRLESLKKGANLVEIDLTCRRRKAIVGTVFPPGSGQPCPLDSSVASVSRLRPSFKREMFRITLRERLPAIPIPLREGDADACLDLQALLDLAYEKADYGFDIDYRKDPVPPLQGDDAAWADALLREKGLRS